MHHSAGHLGRVYRPGNITLVAQTEQTGCSGYKLNVWARIQGISASHEIHCLSGEFVGQSCFNLSAVGAEDVTVSVAALRYGTWTGLSDHGYTPPNTVVATYFLQQRPTTLNGGTPPQDDCSVLGPDWYHNGTECVYTPGSPIIISTRRHERYELTSLADGVQFDIDGDGVREQVAWTPRGSAIAFLVLDRDGDGKITSGKELFGNHTLPSSPNGFHALLQTAMDTNGGVMRGSVSSDDPVFSDLQLWTDRNHNGISEPIELRPASEIVAQIGLGYEETDRQDEHGNLFRFKGWALLRTRPGRNRALDAKDEQERLITIWDVYFKVGQ